MAHEVAIGEVAPVCLRALRLLAQRTHSYGDDGACVLNRQRQWHVRADVELQQMERAPAPRATSKRFRVRGRLVVIRNQRAALVEVHTVHAPVVVAREAR